MKVPDISIIGMGRLGGALARAFTGVNLPIKSIFSRSKTALPEGLALTDAFPADKTQLGQLVFITVPDHAIEDISRQLADLHPDLSSYTFVHCSGNEPADLLSSLREKNARTASFHPLQTFTARSGPEAFSGIYFSMQGSRDSFPLLRRLAGQLGAQAFEVNSKQKALLHAAAVIGSNYLITLLETAVETGSKGGLPKDQVRKVLFPLIETTLENARTGTSNDVLTGPLVRGDIETVENHIGILQEFPELLHLYRTLGARTLDMVAGSGNLSPDRVEALRQILQA